MEGNIALFLCCHSAISNCDHLVEMLKNKVCDSKIITNMRMHRTKCSNIIKNTLYCHFAADLLNDIGKSKYSLLIDESNNISVLKLLGISIIYHSSIHKKIVSTYLGLIEIEQCNAEHIVIAIKNMLKSKNLELTNLMAIGTNNASVMTGINNGVYAKLKAEVPSLTLIRCICHSI